MIPVFDVEIYWEGGRGRRYMGWEEEATISPLLLLCSVTTA
jgi:hypothetical protein